jgi:DNA-binding MarR family transcriptional regulator
LTVSVNGDERLVMDVLERMMFRLRGELYDLSERRFPGLRARHYRLLSRLPAEGERSSRLATASGLTKQALAQTLVPLQDGGYVEVVPDPHDRRARVLRLTDRGREVNAALRERLGAVEAEWAAQVGQERYAAARAVLSQVSQLTDDVPAAVPLEGG